MSDDYFFGDQTKHARLREWALGRMLWGAAIAGAGLVAVGAILVAIWGVSLLLPEESKQAPAPYSALQIDQTSIRIG